MIVTMPSRGGGEAGSLRASATRPATSPEGAAVLRGRDRTVTPPMIGNAWTTMCGGQVADERVERTAGPRDEGTVEPARELVERERPVRGANLEKLDDPVPIGVGDEDRRA